MIEQVVVPFKLSSPMTEGLFFRKINYIPVKHMKTFTLRAVKHWEEVVQRRCGVTTQLYKAMRNLLLLTLL